MPRSRILRGRDSVRRLFRSGRALRERRMDLRYALFPDQKGTCLAGFIAGKRLGKAHERNLIKRRMREAYRQHQHLVRDIAESGSIGFQGIFIAKKAGTPYPMIEQDCIRLLTAVQQKMKEESAAS